MDEILFRLSIPVVFFIFRRPDTTRRVFEAIRRAQPPILFVIADGPSIAQDAALCADTRAIIEGVDWDCEVITNYADVNLGLKKRFSSGLRWVFEQAEEAIILEDDCLPDDTFFRFCQELLSKYRDEPHVMHISANNFFPHLTPSESYYFSRFPHIWGWATWRRAWKNYDEELLQWQNQDYQEKFLRQFPNRLERQFWKLVLNAVVSGEINTWDYQWSYACISRDALSITPACNLVTNIGFANDATHTSDATSPLANLPLQSMPFPLSHPSVFARNLILDRETAKLVFQLESFQQHLWKGLKRRIISFLNPILRQ